MKPLFLRTIVYNAIFGLMLACSATTPEEHLERAKSFREQGDISSAIIELKNALQKSPDLAEARLELGELQLQFGDLESALKELTRALDLGAERERVLPPLLETKLDLGLTQEVLGELETLSPTPRYRAIRGQALLASGQPQEAKTELEAAVTADASLSRAYLGLAQIVSTGPIPDREAALDWLRRGTKALPGDRRLWLTLGELELNAKQAAAADAAFEKARTFPGNDFLPELGLARVRLLEKDPQAAKALVDDVIRRAPKHPLAQHVRGVIALSEGDLDTAELALQTVLSVVAEYPPSLLALAHVKHAQSQPKQAEALLRRYIAVDPRNIGARRALAALLLESGDPAAAAETLEAVRGSLSSGEDLALLGTAYLRAGRLADASSTLALAAEALPQSTAVKSQLALSLAAAGDNAAALAQLDSVVRSSEGELQSEVLRVLIELRSRNLDAALRTAEGLVQRGDQKALAYNLLGAVQIARQDTLAARRAFESALAADAKFGPAALNLARLDQVEGKTADARQRLEEAAVADPADVGVLLGLAQLTLASGEGARAIELLQQARASDPTAVAPRLALARLATEQGDLELAASVATEAEGIAPANPDVLLLQAQVAARAGEGATLARYLDGLQAYLAGAPANGSGYRLPVGELQRQAGRLELARANLDQAAAVAATARAALVALTQLETAANNLDMARAHLAKLRETPSVDAAILAELDGDVAARGEQLDAAVALYRDAASTGSRTATNKLALLLAHKGENRAAVTTLEKWLAANPDDQGVAMVLASVRLQTGDTNGAQADYEALVKRNPDNPVALNNLAWLYFQANDDRAEPTARKALAAAPSNGSVQDTLGWIVAHGDSPGAAEEAVDLLQKAVRAQPEDPTMLYHLAFAQDKAGRKREASQSVERALRVERFADREAAEQLAEMLDER